MRICKWCKADEPTVFFLGRLCDDNSTGDEHEMIEVGECYECTEPATDGRHCTRHAVEFKS